MDRDITTIRAKIGENEFYRLYNKGRAMTLDEAAGYAMGEIRL
jgi:hypothetical protein